METTLTLSFTPDEVVTPGTVLELRSPRPLEPRSAQGAITLRRNGCTDIQGVTVTLSGRGRAARVATQGLSPGAYQLCVGELLDTKGGRVSEPRRIPFVIGALAGRVPDELRVEHAVHLAVGELSVRRLAAGEKAADGERYVEVVKAVHRETGEAVDLAHDERGERVDADELLLEVQRRRAERFGAVHDTLWRHLDGVADDDRVDVVVWPRLEGDLTGYDKPTDRRLEEPHPAERELSQRARRATSELLTALERAGAEVRERPDDDVPVVHATVPAAQVRELARADAVGAVFLDDRSAVTDLGDSIAVARSDRAHALGFDGTGIRVAVFEDGPSVTTNLVFAGRYTS